MLSNKGGVKMKKLMLIVVGAAMIGLLAAGCKGTPKDEHPTVKQSAKEQPAKEQPPKDHPAH